MKRLALFGAVTAVLLAGCGGDSGSTAAFKHPKEGIALGSSGQLVGAGGQTLYAFSGDIEHGGSACFGACAKHWLPLIIHRPEPGTGVREALLGTIQRPDGEPQATYNGWPLYERDSGNGANVVNGFGGEWSPIKADGKPVAGFKRSHDEFFLAAPPAQITVHPLPGLGKVILDSTPKTYYYFTADKRGAGSSACYGKCALLWKPKPSGGTPEVLGGAHRYLVGTFARKDGFAQATYNGWPIYTYIRERNEEQKGVGRTEFGGSFHPLHPDGSRADR